MTNILITLEKHRKRCVNKAEKRDAKFLKRTEKWQESATGALYEAETANWAELVYALDKAVEVAKSINNPIL